ncbi:MAG: hypothetical protein IJY25_01070 [Bacilli bacterium]|nr:hypothetical protein [Bacilli bacterium]
MKENRGMSTKIVDIKEYSSDEVGLLVQVVLTELLIIFAIISIISDAFMPAFYSIIAMTMFTMAYNNKKIYKKKYMTSVYVIVGLFVAITTIVEYIF